jgi:hypothetical protein
MRLYGEYLQKGEHGPKNVPEAYRWYLRAGQLGDKRALFRAAEIRFHGWGGVGRDQALAYRHWLESAKCGDKTAMVIVSLEYRRGDYLERDVALAKEWKRKAITAGIDWSRSRRIDANKGK